MILTHNELEQSVGISFHAEKSTLADAVGKFYEAPGSKTEEFRWNKGKVNM